MPVLRHAGVSLHYDWAGTGPAALFVHGWTCNRTFWKRQVHAFRDRYTVITVDLRGHGESSHPRTGYTVGAMVGDLEHLVRALLAAASPGIEPARATEPEAAALGTEKAGRAGATGKGRARRAITPRRPAKRR